MDKKSGMLVMMVLAVVVGMLFLWNDTAEAARRLGGGGSFGSKPSYNRSAPKTPASPTKANPAQPGSPASPLGRGLGGFGGMMGGLLMGGLIGSLLFGGGHGFGGPGILDILLIGGGLFLLFRYLKSRKMAAASPGGGAMAFDRGSPFSSGGWGAGDAVSSGALSSPATSWPPGFDPEEFLKGATAIYTRLQTSWDKRNLEDIRRFTSPEVFNEIQRQAKEDPRPGKTELLMINPNILEARDVDDQTIVSVRYDVTMREDTDTVAKQVLELWHFSRDRNNPDDFWLLEGIQQME